MCVCEVIVCERWYVTKWCVCVWVCELLYVKFVCVKLKYVRDGMWQSCVCVWVRCECVWSYCMWSYCMWEIVVCECVCVEAGGGRRRRRRSRPGIQNQKQEPHTKMWEKCILLSKMFRCSRFWHSSCHFCFQHLCCRVWAILFVCVGHCEVIESDRRPRKTIDSVWFSMIQLVHPLDDLAKKIILN